MTDVLNFKQHLLFNVGGGIYRFEETFDKPLVFCVVKHGIMWVRQIAVEKLNGAESSSFESKSVSFVCDEAVRHANKLLAHVPIAGEILWDDGWREGSTPRGRETAFWEALQFLFHFWNSAQEAKLTPLMNWAVAGKYKSFEHMSFHDEGGDPEKYDEHDVE